jgi:hypothetical protein
VKGRWPPKKSVPAPAKVIDVEITQARDLSVKLASVRQGRTDLDARHGA